MTNMEAIHILNHGKWRDYLDTKNIPNDALQAFRAAINEALEALAIRATAEKTIEEGSYPCGNRLNHNVS